MANRHKDFTKLACDYDDEYGGYGQEEDFVDDEEYQLKQVAQQRKQEQKKKKKNKGV